MAFQRPVFNKSSKPIFKIDSIFLGIDFGTSFTKVSYSYTTGGSTIQQIFTLKWKNAVDDYYLPTILYIQNERLFFEKPTGESKEVRYFKYSIVTSDLINNRVTTKNKFEKLCCVFFLAHVIKKALNRIQLDLQLETLDSISIYVNMGVPLENFYEEKKCEE